MPETNTSHGPLHSLGFHGCGALAGSINPLKNHIAARRGLGGNRPAQHGR